MACLPSSDHSSSRYRRRSSMPLTLGYRALRRLAQVGSVLVTCMGTGVGGRPEQCGISPGLTLCTGTHSPHQHDSRCTLSVLDRCRTASSLSTNRTCRGSVGPGPTWWTVSGLWSPTCSHIVPGPTSPKPIYSWCCGVGPRPTGEDSCVHTTMQSSFQE